MTFKRAKDVLDYARTAHHLISEFYHKLSEQTSKERLKLLLDYLSEHEKHLEEGLSKYEDEASDIILKTWFQFTECEDMKKYLEETVFNPDSTENDVMRIAMDLDDCFIQKFKEMSTRTESERAREVFNNILELEKSEKRRMVLSALRFEDL